MGCSKDLVAANLQLGLWVERDYLGQWVSSETGGRSWILGLCSGELEGHHKHTMCVRGHNVDRTPWMSVP